MTILAATDLSEASTDALRLAAMFAVRRGEPLVVAFARTASGATRRSLLGRLRGRSTAEEEPVIEGPVDEAEQRAREFVKMFTLNALDGWVEVPARMRFEVGHGVAADVLIALAEALQPSLVVAGTVGRGVLRLRRVVLGKTAHHLVRRCPAPTLLVPPDPGADHAALELILAPIDDSPGARAALKVAVQLRQELGARLLPLHVFEPPRAHASEAIANNHRFTERFEQDMQRRILTILDEVGAGQIVDAFVLQRGKPGPAILKVAIERGADLICLGSHGRRGVSRVVLGNTAERVIAEAPCPLLIVPVAQPAASPGAE